MTKACFALNNIRLIILAGFPTIKTIQARVTFKISRKICNETLSSKTQVDLRSLTVLAIKSALRLEPFATVVP